MSAQGAVLKEAIIDWRAVFAEASMAAKTACAELESANPGVWFPCGFSWVNIKPARGPLVAILKELGEGYTDTYYGGYTIHNPSKNPTQWMDAKIAGSKAFAGVLGKYGVKAIVCSRID